MVTRAKIGYFDKKFWTKNGYPIIKDWSFITLKFDGYCWFCGEKIESNKIALFSRIYKVVCHEECKR